MHSVKKEIEFHRNVSKHEFNAIHTVAEQRTMNSLCNEHMPSKLIFLESN